MVGSGNSQQFMKLLDDFSFLATAVCAQAQDGHAAFFQNAVLSGIPLCLSAACHMIFRSVHLNNQNRGLIYPVEQKKVQMGQRIGSILPFLLGKRIAGLHQGCQ